MGHYVPLSSFIKLHSGIDDNFTYEVAEKHYRKCEYCESWYSKELTKCPNCYAPTKTMED